MTTNFTKQFFRLKTISVFTMDKTEQQFIRQGGYKRTPLFHLFLKLQLMKPFTNTIIYCERKDA